MSDSHTVTHEIPESYKKLSSKFSSENTSAHCQSLSSRVAERMPFFAFSARASIVKNKFGPKIEINSAETFHEKMEVVKYPFASEKMTMTILFDMMKKENPFEYEASDKLGGELKLTMKGQTFPLKF